MAECTAETFMELAPNLPKATNQRRMVFFKATQGAQNDIITVPNLTTVESVYGIATDGTVMTATLATNVVTVTNAVAKTFAGHVIGT